jgi:NMD protein affecting ribosome stability and mRNA decay
MFCPKCESARIVSLPQQKEMHLCRDCCSQHTLKDGVWRRDFYAEAQYEKMASQIGVEVAQLVEDEYAYASSRKV